MNEIIINSCTLSKIIYLEDETILNEYRHDHPLIKSCTKNPILKNFNNSNCAVFTYNNDVYFIFRGTKTESDVISDLDILLDEFLDIDKCFVHRGFYYEFNNVKDFIIENLKDTENKKIIFAGHSLGGAIATLVSAFVVHSNYKSKNDVMCITFGCPRVGSSHFVSFYNKNVSNNLRFTNYGDPVINLPPKFIGYQHVCEPTIFKNGKLLNTKSLKYKMLKITNFLGVLWNYIYNYINKNPIVEKHAIKLYLINIMKNFSQ